MGLRSFLTSLPLAAVLLLLHLASYGECQYHESQSLEPEVFFPPAQPSHANLHALCVLGGGRPRYPESFFPRSGYAYARRRGTAVNRMESWSSECCSGGVAQGDDEILCCAQQAWETSLSYFCSEEFSVKTLPHHCCEETGDARLNCFDMEAPNPYYLPIPGYTAPNVPVKLGFTWDPSTCMRVE